ncbi:MAG: NAD(P)-dependent oxidoreductase [Opitutales bacterium]|nr:NAD(P)-dependent oxidoreductase [Opitutales bacterium]
MISKPRVLVTGAAGIVGTTLWKAWESEDCYELTLTDCRPIEGANSRCEIGDISDYHFVKSLCRDQDVLVHLAYIPSDNVGRDTLELTDIGTNMRLFQLAQEAGVQKIVFASTNHITGWNEHLNDPPIFSTTDQINPDGWYAAMKSMAEVAGRNLVNTEGMRFISIRIGSFTGNSKVNCLRYCSTLLTPRDAVQLFGLAVYYEGPKKFFVTYGVSNNIDGDFRGFLDISPAMEEFGYQPQDQIATERHRYRNPLN